MSPIKTAHECNVLASRKPTAHDGKKWKIVRRIRLFIFVVQDLSHSALEQNSTGLQWFERGNRVYHSMLSKRGQSQ